MNQLVGDKYKNLFDSVVNLQEEERVVIDCWKLRNSDFCWGYVIYCYGYILFYECFYDVDIY